MLESGAMTGQNLVARVLMLTTGVQVILNVNFAASVL